jgi:hypothetical protein
VSTEYYAVCDQANEYAYLGKIIPNPGVNEEWHTFLKGEFDCPDWSRPARVYALYKLLQFVMRHPNTGIRVLDDSRFVDWEIERYNPRDRRETRPKPVEFMADPPTESESLTGA